MHQVLGKKGDGKKSPSPLNQAPGEKEPELKRVNNHRACNERKWRKWKREKRERWMREREFFSGRRMGASSSCKDLEDWTALGVLTRVAVSNALRSILSLPLL